MYKMLKALQEVRDHVVVNPNMLDWDFVDEMVEALKDVAELTTRMQKEVYLMGDFFFDLFDCRHALVNHSSDNPRLADMLHHLNERTGALLSTVTYAAAIVCDPRLNTHNSLAINDRQREDAIVSIQQLVVLKLIESRLTFIGTYFMFFSSISQNFLARKYKQLKRIERGDFSNDDEPLEEPLTPRTPLPHPAKRTKESGCHKVSAFSFNLPLNKMTSHRNRCP